MGKIRVKTLGAEDLERDQQQKNKVKKEQKDARKTAKAPGMKGGERVVAVGPSEEELANLEVKKIEEEPARNASASVAGGKKVKKTQGAKKRERGKNYRDAIIQVDSTRVYPLEDAIPLLKKVNFTTFDGTVELHVNTTEKGVSGQVVLPHGTGKEIRVAIADDAVLAQVEKGKIEFDVLLAHPSMMPKLAKVARFLGPRGLMPNPKNGTISETPEKVAQNYKAGQVHFKTEAAAPIMHLTVGKISMKDEDLGDNIKTILGAIGPAKIRTTTLKSTMSPGIKIQI